MAQASYVQPSFLGGEWSKFAQGRFDLPQYRTALNVCLNALPVESGAWTRRSGTRHAGHSRGGLAAKVSKFDFAQARPYTLEFTEGKLRFRSGANLVVTDDVQDVVAVSTADPAVVQTSAAVDWVTGDTLIFPGASTPLLENRQFLATKVDTTHFELADAITNEAIDGATLGALTAGATVARVHELSTSYIGGKWASVRGVQAETTDLLLNGEVAPQALVVDVEPTDDEDAQFAISAATFKDGPYLDPFKNGVRATPSAKTGIISITLAFPAYVSTKAYDAGDFVTYSSVNYISLQSANVNHQPDISGTYWAATTAGAAINNGLGFLGTDIGRLVRLFSEPAEWDIGTTYAASSAAAPVVVSYNPTGLPGATTYWQSLVASNLGFPPGSDLTHWQLVPQGAAIWSWGRITSLSNIIDRALAGSVNFGDMVNNGGVAAAFDGVFSQLGSACAALNTTTGSPPLVTFPAFVTNTSYVGKNYSGASAQAIMQATVYPSSDNGFASGYLHNGSSTILTLAPTITLNLRAKSSAPASASDGTLLGTSGTIANTFNPVTILSNDQTTTWNYVWIEAIASASTGIYSGVGAAGSTTNISNLVGEVSFFSPFGTGTGDGVSVEILGPSLLNTTAIRTWRLGAYSNTTGWPTCGTWYEGRLWLGGAIDNRFDASVSNGVAGSVLDFSPTNPYGTVADSNAISYTLNSNGSNPIFWMEPDQQGIIVGTQAGEFIIKAPTNGPITPSNIAAPRITKAKCANIEPQRTENTIIMVQRHRQKLMEYFADVNYGRFSAPNMADKASHIAKNVAELAYTQAVAPVLWGRNDDGALFGCTYKRDTLTTSQPPTFAGFHRHELGTARTVESLCAGPAVGGELDSLTLVTNDATGIRHVEILTDTPDEDAPLTDGWFLDDAVEPTSMSRDDTPITGAPYGGMTLNGLWHLNGKTVQVFAGGLDCGNRGDNATSFTDFEVEDGSVFVPFGDGVSAGPGNGLFTAEFAESGITFVVGMTYNSDGQLLRPVAPADSGARNGPAFGKEKRNHKYAIQLNASKAISIGATFDALMPVLFRQANGQAIGVLDAFSGIHKDTLDDDSSMDAMICWRVSRPYPANVVALGGFIQTQDE